MVYIQVKIKLMIIIKIIVNKKIAQEGKKKIL